MVTKKRDLPVPNCIKLFNWIQNDIYLRSNAFYCSINPPRANQYDVIMINFDSLQLQREANHFLCKSFFTIKIAFDK